MNNLEFLKEVVYQERIHRELHGKAHAEAYMRVLRIAAKEVAYEVENAFKDATFDMYGLAQGGPFVEHEIVHVNHVDYMATV